MIHIELYLPAELRHHKGNFKHDCSIDASSDCDVKATMESSFLAVQSVGRIKATLEALQSVLCDAEFQVRCEHNGITVDGYIHAWSQEAFDVAKMAIASLGREINALSRIPTDELHATVVYKLERTVTELSK